MTGGNNVFFHEEQQFRQILLWFLIIYPSLVLLAVVINMLRESEFDLVLILIFLFAGIGLPLLFYFSRLTTEVRFDGIYFRFFPFHLSFHKIAFHDLKSYRAVTYDPIGDYLGWGIRYSHKGKAYNVSGDRGVQVELVNGKRILFGSRRPEEFVQAISLAMEKNT